MADDYADSEQGSGQPISAFIDSYIRESNAVEVTSEFVVADRDEQAKMTNYYRISPKELWRYDLNTKQYIFLKSLPED